ncbi:hypothetical protein A2U01_0031778 [Trifolium medium]|uniref:Uncharacterized protein n=1 Tax=Trifolium medium TaxID=97028 RepID=A0A392PFX1_9FABA|nr:hypothetical protein [Trifolium medium]
MKIGLKGVPMKIGLKVKTESDEVLCADRSKDSVYQHRGMVKTQQGNKLSAVIVGEQDVTRKDNACHHCRRTGHQKKDNVLTRHTEDDLFGELKANL